MFKKGAFVTIKPEFYDTAVEAIGLRKHYYTYDPDTVKANRFKIIANGVENVALEGYPLVIAVAWLDEISIEDSLDDARKKRAIDSIIDWVWRGEDELIPQEEEQGKGPLITREGNTLIVRQPPLEKDGIAFEYKFEISNSKARIATE